MGGVVVEVVVAGGLGVEAMAGGGASLFAAAMVAVVVAMVSVGSAGGADAPTADCTAAFNSLVPCYTYVTGSVATPPPECCSGLSSLNKDNPACLCNLITTQLNSSSSSTSGVNVTKAYSLPKDCSITLNTTTCPGHYYYYYCYYIVSQFLFRTLHLSSMSRSFVQSFIVA